VSLGIDTYLAIVLARITLATIHCALECILQRSLWSSTNTYL